MRTILQSSNTERRHSLRWLMNITTAAKSVNIGQQVHSETTIEPSALVDQQAQFQNGTFTWCTRSCARQISQSAIAVARGGCGYPTKLARWTHRTRQRPRCTRKGSRRTRIEGAMGGVWIEISCPNWNKPKQHRDYILRNKVRMRRKYCTSRNIRTCGTGPESPRDAIASSTFSKTLFMI